MCGKAGTMHLGPLTSGTVAMVSAALFRTSSSMFLIGLHDMGRIRIVISDCKKHAGRAIGVTFGCECDIVGGVGRWGREEMIL